VNSGDPLFPRKDAEATGDGACGDGSCFGESADVDVEGAGTGGAGEDDQSVEDSFVAGTSWACPACRICHYGGFDLVEFVVYRCALVRKGRCEPGRDVEGSLPLPGRVVAAAVVIVAEPNKSGG
jgi:hypothetical protein